MPVSSSFCSLAQSQDTSVKHSRNCKVLDSYRCVRVFIFYAVENVVLIAIVQAKPSGHRR